MTGRRRRQRERARTGPGLRPATRQALALIVAELSRLDADLAALDLYGRAQALSAEMAEVKLASMSPTPPATAALAQGAAVAILALALTVEGQAAPSGTAEASPAAPKPAAT
jgi:hypothetical protein